MRHIFNPIPENWIPISVNSDLNMKLQKGQMGFMIFYLVLRTFLDLFFIFYIISAGCGTILPWFAILPGCSLGIIGYNLYLHIVRKNEKQVIFTYIFNLIYVICIAVIGRIYFVPSEGSFCVDESPFFYIGSGMMCLLEICKYFVLKDNNSTKWKKKDTLKDVVFTY